MLLRSRFINEDNPNYPKNTLYLFAENVPCMRHNDMLLNSLPGLQFIIHGLDDVPKDVPIKAIEDVKKKKQTDTAGLSSVLIIKIKVKLTVNIDINDKLIRVNQIGIVSYVKVCEGYYKTKWLPT